MCKRSLGFARGVFLCYKNLKVCQRSLGFVRGVFLCFRSLRCVIRVWDLLEECFRVIGI